MILFEKKNWLLFYLKISPNVRVFYVIFLSRQVYIVNSNTLSIYKQKGKLRKKPQPLGVFLNKTLTNFFFQIKPQYLKRYQKKPSLDNCTGNVEFFVEISYI